MDNTLTIPAPALNLTVGSHEIKLTAAQHQSLKAVGLSADWLSSLVQVLGPKVADVIIRLILKKAEATADPTKFKGVFDVLGVDQLRRLVANALLEYKGAIGAQIEEWVEKGIEALADVIDPAA